MNLPYADAEIDALAEMIRSLPAPDAIPIPVDMYERIVRAIEREDRKARRRRARARKKRRGW